MGYVTPADVDVSDNWQDHKDRDSAEPGTDYKTAYGTDCRMPGDGYIWLIDNSNSGAEGKRLQLIMDNGQIIDFIHASYIYGFNGQRVLKGQRGIFFSGASGYGNDWYYGPHVHVTLRAHSGLPFSDTLDFEQYVFDDLPGPSKRLEDDMPAFFEGNVISWPNGFSNSYDAQVWAALKSYCDDPDNPSTQWVRDTYVRESWATVEALQKMQIDKIPTTSSTVTAMWSGVGILAGLLIVNIVSLVMT
jgi:murein DD-endopeptidase MepM/ murein hydrolase activator NlpD